MPLWEIFHTANAFSTPQSKALIAKDITGWYTAAGLPAFYVNVLFRPMAGEDMWIGGKPAAAFPGDPQALERPFVRFSIQHLAHKQPSEAVQVSMCDSLDRILSPHLENYDWEYNIVEPPRALWRINGINPPPFGSEGEKKWALQNRPTRDY